MKQLSDMENRHTVSLAEGKRCYMSLLEGTTTDEWKEKNFHDLFAYYKMENPTFMAQMEKDYDLSSNKLRMLLILEHMGFSEKEIEKTMVIKDVTVRSYRSKIQKCRRQ